MTLRFYVLTIICLLHQSPAIALSQIRTAAQESSEPKFIATTLQGKPAVSGICIDIMRPIEKVDNSMQFVDDQQWQPRARIDANMHSGNLDAICGIQRIERHESRYNFIETPLFSVNYLLAVRADDDIEVFSWDDIRKLGSNGIILTLHGFGIVDILEKLGGLKIDSGATLSASNLKKLLAGSGRFYCHRSPGIKAEIRKAGLETKVKLLSKLQLSQKFYMGVSKTLSFHDVKKISAALAKLESNGELKKLFEKYQE
ncbi:substrate-binding periplasmic protein [Undibacterium sp. TJN19]|uniref:substrate-binding periplasmic protein n=1 Tax=Undibacterium sp. TJN19 TaxID=3413055 RepID=UPI003BF205D0